ncbi:hypothetical protein BDV18DRAFT_79905 [Aspergillus unguis]
MSSALRSADRSVSGKVKPSIEVDPYDSQPDSQLQRSLLDSTCRDKECRSSTNSNNYNYSYGYYPSRTYSWELEGRESLESDFLSEVSGQFDDAEEYESASEYQGQGMREGDSHSIKRRRSNDWPKRSAENLNGENPSRRTPTRQRWPFHHYGRHASSPRARSPRHVRPGRRSRFVEGHMADTVSEKPPSIFFPDEARTNEAAAATGATRATHRNSGIFRFGKAIASAFNPFGGWGSVSEIWKKEQVQSQPQGQQPREDDDRLRQAQLAYEELKKAGFQGTNKGSYMQSLQGGASAGGLSSIPDQTWKAIQEKMEYGSTPATTNNVGGGGQHSRQSSVQTPSNRNSMSGNSLRPSFPDLNLRKAKSSLAIKKQDTDSRGQEVRHQKSRKDLHRQAKLLKRVSNLEDKLTRARRELRELSGDCEEQVVARSSLNEERPPYQRKFVPGALPSLPSERLLHERERENESEPLALLSPVPKDTLQVPEFEHEGQTPSQIRVSKRTSQTPKHRSSSAQSRSSSRKRKSPDPESRKKSEPERPEHEHPPPVPEHRHIQDHPTSEPAEAEVPMTATPQSRKPKLPKTARGDSPGSVERKQKQRRSPGAENASTSPGEERASRPLRSTTRNRSATPVLRMKRGQGNLRSTTSPGHGNEDDKENYHRGDDQDMDLKPDMQDEPPVGTAVSPSPSPSTPSRRKARYEYIPPVPPLPKDLAATAAKVDRRLAREMGKRRAQMEKDGKPVEKFQWPEDIF